MTFINWSSSEEMLGLLSEYIADERSESFDDSTRRRLLDQLLSDVSELAETEHRLTSNDVVTRLRKIERSQDELIGDPVHDHLVACIEELERIN
jgi:2-phospho-L-lactate guanylyltransferase (CobY/MobA/RfbA family)